jgi:prepilin-type N-terminal cleavage/methylation domain-containing protein
MKQRSGTGRPGLHDGFTVMEVMVVSALMSLLALFISGAWTGFGRTSADVIARCRVAQEANLAAETLARDFAGCLPGQTAGPVDLGRLVGRSIHTGPSLWLCYDGEPANGMADWAGPDVVIVYDLQSNKLRRTNQQTGASRVVADNVHEIQLTELAGGLKIDLTFTYRDVTRTYTTVAKDP